MPAEAQAAARERSQESLFARLGAFRRREGANGLRQNQLLGVSAQRLGFNAPRIGVSAPGFVNAQSLGVNTQRLSVNLSAIGVSAPAARVWLLAQGR